MQLRRGRWWLAAAGVHVGAAMACCALSGVVPCWTVTHVDCHLLLPTLTAIGLGSRYSLLLLDPSLFPLPASVAPVRASHLVHWQSRRSPRPSPVPALRQARELEELAQIYVSRGLPYDLARQVICQAGGAGCRGLVWVRGWHRGQAGVARG